MLVGGYGLIDSRFSTALFMNHTDELLNSIDEAFIEMDHDLNILFINKRVEELWNLKANDILGTNLKEKLLEYFTDKGFSIISKSLKENVKVSDVFFSNPVKNWFFLIVNPQGNNLLVSFYPLPNAHVINKELEEENWRFREVEAFGHIGSFSKKFVDEYIHWSDELYRIHGLEPQSEQITVRRLSDFIHPDEKEQTQEALDSIHSKGIPLTFIHRIVRKDGIVRLVRRSAQILYDNDVPVKIYGTVLDITDQADAEEKVKVQETLLRDAEKIGHTGSYEADLQTMAFHFSEGVSIMLGYEFGTFEPTVEFIESISHPDDIEKVRSILETAQSTKQPYEYIRRIFRPDGEMRYILSKGKVVTNAKGDAIKLVAIVQDITDMKLAEEKLNQNNDLLRAIFNASTFGITVFESIRDVNGEIVDFLYLVENEVANSLWKNGRVGSRLLEIYPNAKQIGLFDLYKKVVDTGEDLDVEMKMYDEHFNGWYRLTAVKFEDRLAVTVENISKRKLADEDLNKNLSILNQTEEIAHMGSWEYDLLEGKLIWSGGMYSIFYLDRSTIVSPDIYLSYVIPEDKYKAEQLIDRIKNGADSIDETLRVNLNHQQKVIQIKAFAFKDEEGVVVKSLGIDVDITQKVIADAELKEQNHFIRQITEASPDLITVYDIQERHFTYASPQVYAFLGYSPEELIGYDYGTIVSKIHPDDILSLKAFTESFNHISDGDIQEIEYRASDAESKWKWLRARGKVFQRADDGKVREIIVITQDITDKKLARKEIFKQNHFIRQITQATPDIITIFDLTHQSYIYFNKDLYPIIGYTAKQIKNMTTEEIWGFIYPDDQPFLKKFHQSFSGAADNDIRELKYRIKNIDNEWWWVNQRSKVFKRNMSGDVTQIISVIQDYAQEKVAEEKIRENEFMQALLQKKDEFMSVASHELKTPITTIKASLQVLQRQVEKHVDENVLLVFIKKAILQINKLTTLIADLMDNTKIQAGKMQLNFSVCLLGDVISDTIAHSFDGKEIIVTNNVTQPVEVDKIRIEQVLTNFLTNAIKYSPGSDKVLLNVIQQEDFVKVEVRDFGIGIPKEKLANVFDRFFRVNEASQFSGLGLGLFISAEIIKQHNGTYGVESEEGKGSCFWFRIPTRQIKSNELI